MTAFKWWQEIGSPKLRNILAGYSGEPARRWQELEYLIKQGWQSGYRQGIEDAEGTGCGDVDCVCPKCPTGQENLRRQEANEIEKETLMDLYHQAQASQRTELFRQLVEKVYGNG